MDESQVHELISSGKASKDLSGEKSRDNPIFHIGCLGEKYWNEMEKKKRDKLIHFSKDDIRKFEFADGNNYWIKSKFFWYMVIVEFDFSKEEDSEELTFKEKAQLRLNIESERKSNMYKELCLREIELVDYIGNSHLVTNSIAVSKYKDGATIYKNNKPKSSILYNNPKTSLAIYEKDRYIYRVDFVK